MTKHKAIMAFDTFIGIDYSGASHTDAPLPGLRVYQASLDHSAIEILPPASSRRYWSRRQVAEWLAEIIRSKTALIGIDHGLCAPLEYFTQNQLALDWTIFLNTFTHIWNTDTAAISVEQVRKRLRSEESSPRFHAKWRRLCEVRSKAKSIFHFDVPGSVAKSTHAGLPWIKYLLTECSDHLHVWPFHGWEIPKSKSVLTEAYPSLYRKSLAPPEHFTGDQRDAWAIAEWLRRSYLNKSLYKLFQPQMPEDELRLASLEGWILGL